MTDAPTPREVLARINAVLVVAGLNDTIFSIRDCNSTLFLLLFKKASFSPPQAPSAVEASPMRECYGGACQARRPRPLGGPVHCIRMHPLLLSCRSLLGAGHQPHAPCPSAVALAADEPFPPPPSPAAVLQAQHVFVSLLLAFVFQPQRLLLAHCLRNWQYQASSLAV